MAEFSTDRETPKPVASRPQMPEGYGVPQDAETMLSWHHARDRLEGSRNYWVATVRPDGRPHATPIWGVWLDERFYFDGSPQTRRGRNLAQNPHVAVHLESGDDVVIVEGRTLPLPKPPRSLTTRLAEAYAAKYADSGYAPEADQWDNGGLYVMQPQLALAWTTFPDDCTRWRF